MSKCIDQHTPYLKNMYEAHLKKLLSLKIISVYAFNILNFLSIDKKLFIANCSLLYKEFSSKFEDR